MSFRTILILINLIAIGALVVFIVFRVVNLRRNPHHRDPENLTPFYDDDVLEGAHLERALGVSLIALVIVLIGMIAYFLAEPFRAEAQDDFFAEKSVERGAVLFANDQSEDYNATFSLQCANCHGVDGSGGGAPTFIASVDPRCDPEQSVNEDLAAEAPYCLPHRVSWAAPNLQLAALRYSRGQIAEHHHVRPARHADAGMGRGERQGLAQRAEHRRPGQLHPEHLHHERQGQGTRRQGPRRPPEAVRRPRGGRGRRGVGAERDRAARASRGGSRRAGSAADRPAPGCRADRRSSRRRTSPRPRSGATRCSSRPRAPSCS